MIGDQLQVAIVAALKAAAIADGRIYDRVPKKPIFPYVTIGDETVANAGTGCGDAWTCYPDVHVWSRPSSGSKREVKQIAAGIVPVLQIELDIAGHEIIVAELDSIRYPRDPDGITEHAVLTFRYEIEPAS